MAGAFGPEHINPRGPVPSPPSNRRSHPKSLRRVRRWLVLVVAPAGQGPPAGKPATDPFAEAMQRRHFKNAGHLIGPTASPMLPRNKARKPPFGGLLATCCNLGSFWSGRRGSNPRPRPWQGPAPVQLVAKEH